MQLLDVVSAGTNYKHTWPNGAVEKYESWVEYQARSTDSEHRIKIAFGYRPTYGVKRRRVLVLIDGHPHAEFLGADDFDHTGDVVSEIKVPGDVGERICRYPNEVIPERYGGFPVLGLPSRVTGKGVHKAWGVVANISDHRTLCGLAALRRSERNR